MKVSIEWLRDFTDVNVDLATLADRLTRTGTKVETATVTGSNFSGIYIGQIVAIKPHENSDHLQICRVNMGSLSKEICPELDTESCLQIVTAAKNVFVGAKVPVAIVGAILTDKTEIKNAKLRGVASQGMFCSVAETGHSTKEFPEAVEDGIWILAETTELGIKLQEYMGLGDEVLDFEITSNRPDCLSVEGLARETAITLQKDFVPLPYKETVGSLQDKSSNYLNVENQAPDACLRYYGRVVKNVKIEESPLWLRRRLLALGLHPINNIVDITNYVMLELGQPLHAFDVRDLAGQKIIIRHANKGEKLKTLDGVERALTEDMLVIADDCKAVALAGVMGGENSEIKADTSTIFFEAANFVPEVVRNQAAALRLRSESSSRFDKAVDPDLAKRGLARALELVEQLKAGEVVSETLTVPEQEFALPASTFTAEKINKFLGTDITEQYMQDIFTKLGCQVEITSTQQFKVTPPNWRRDLEGMADYAEEVARFYGYDNIPSTMPHDSLAGAYTLEQSYERLIKDSCVALGFSEIITLSFEAPETFAKLGFTDKKSLAQVKIANAASDTSSLRTDLLPACLRVISNNVTQFNESGKLFEVGNCYFDIPDASGLPSFETRLLASIFANDKQAKAGSLFFELKNLLHELASVLGIKAERFTYSPLTDLSVYHPYRSARVYLDKQEIGEIAYVDKQLLKSYDIKTEVAVLEINLALIYTKATFERKQKKISRFPAYSLDLAFEMDQAETVLNLLNILKTEANSNLEKISIFDVYQGERVAANKKSVAFNLTYRNAERTLTEADVSDNVKAMVQAAENAGYKLRSATTE